MFGLKIFVRVQTFRRVPPVLPCNFCHPAVLCNLSCEHSVRRAIVIRRDTLHTKFSSQGKLWQLAQKEYILLSHDECINHRMSVWFRESLSKSPKIDGKLADWSVLVVIGVIKEIKKDNSALSIPYLLHQLHCTMVPLSTRMLLWSKFPMYFGQLLQEHIIQN